MPTGCLVIPQFPLACELADRPELGRGPAVVARDDAPVVDVASPAAERHGVEADQSLREALARCPTLTVVQARPALYDRAWEAVLDAVEHVVAGVEPGPQGVAWVDLGGRRWSKSQPEVAQALLACAPPRLVPRLGVAPGRFTAQLAACSVPASAPAAVRVVTDAEVARFVAAQPVDVLALDAERLRRLRLLGLTTLGALAALPRHALVAQLGPEGGEVSALARGGDDHRPVRPRPAVESVRERLESDEPLATRLAVLAAAEHALNAALRRPERRGRAVRQVVLRTETEGDGRWERVVTCREPLVERDRLWRVLEPVLAEARLPGPVRVLTVELRRLVAVRGWQGELVTARPVRQERLEEGLRQLKARYGRCPVSRVVQVEPWSRIPERRFALIDLDP